MSWIAWTTGQIAQAVRMYEDGASLAAISEATGHPVGSCSTIVSGRSRVRRKRPWTVEDEAELERMTDSGASAREIADRLGRSVDSVYRRRRKYRESKELG